MDEAQETIDESTALILECRTLKIQTADDYRYAAGKRGAIKDLIKALTARAQPRIDEAKEHLQNLRDDLNRDTFALARASEHIGKLLVDWDTEQDRIRRQRQLEAEAKARQEALDEKKRMAELAKQVGDKELAKEIKAAPLVVEPVVVVKETPSVKETGVSYREDWKYQITDMGKLPRNYLMVDEVAIGKVVRALKGNTNIPGVRVYPVKIPVQRTT